jgi:DNA-binding transcriptional ArsR family regulator
MRRSGTIQPTLAGGRERTGSAAAGMSPATKLRLHGDDLARIRFGTAPAPLVEAVLGLAELRHQPAETVQSCWAVHARRVFPAAARPLLDLIPASGSWPMFLDPATPDLDEALEIVNTTPRTRLRSELAVSWRRSDRPPTWLRDLAGGDRDALAIVVRGLGAFYAACVAPWWPGIVASFRSDVAERVGAAAEGGLAKVFGTLHQDLAWRDCSLERAARSLNRAGRPGEFRLDGQGLLILPSALWSGPPLFSICTPDSGGNVLIYAAPLARGAGSVNGSRNLAALMGRTRAAALRVLREPCSTAELARRLGISAPSASEHAAALRGADLIRTERRGRGVCHSLTPLGRSLLDGYRADGPVADRGCGQSA